jgi:hypothetical protein
MVLDDVFGHPKSLRETHVMHVAPECFGTWPLKANAALAVEQIACTVFRVHPFIPPSLSEPDDARKS